MYVEITWGNKKKEWKFLGLTITSKKFDIKSIIKINHKTKELITDFNESQLFHTLLLPKSVIMNIPCVSDNETYGIGSEEKDFIDKIIRIIKILDMTSKKIW